MSPVKLTHVIHDALLLNCTLSRTTKKPRANRESTFSHTVICTRVSKSLVDSDTDHLFPTLTLYLPYAGYFFTMAHHFTSSGSNIHSSSPQFVPLPFSWLRLQYKDGQPAGGSLISRIHRTWSMDWCPGPTPNICHCTQFSNFEDGPPWSPLT